MLRTHIDARTSLPGGNQVDGLGWLKTTFRGKEMNYHSGETPVIVHFSGETQL